MRLSERVAVLLAPNPSPMTLEGTNTYIVRAGLGSIVIDPGPVIIAHLDAVAAYARRDGRPVLAIFVTHGHSDHFPGAAYLAEITGAPVYAHRNATFAHDRVLDEGALVETGETTLRAIDAPGHTFDSLAFRLEEEDAVFTGDVVIGRGTVVIAPPGGAMRPYQATLRRLLAEHGEAQRLYGGHGLAIEEPRAKLREYIDHRERREIEILAHLHERPATIPQLVRDVYAHVDQRVWPAAARQILAYLEALESEGRVSGARLDRRASEEEAAILDPDLRKISNPDLAQVAGEEFGYGAVPPLVEYAAV